METDERRRGVMRTLVLLVAVALAFYLGIMIVMTL